MANRNRNRNFGITICGIFLLVAFLSGCASHSQILAAPNGSTKRCASAGFGIGGSYVADKSFGQCISDLKSMGYVPLEEVGRVGIRLADSKNDIALVADVAPDGPAKKAGILPGDIVISVDGKTVFDRTSAYQLMFGRPNVTMNIVARRGDKEIAFDVLREQRVKNDHR